MCPSADPAASESVPLDSPIRVVIVDDHVIVLEALAAALGDHQDIEVVGIADSVTAFEQLVETIAAFDVGVFDLGLGNGRGTDLVNRAREAGAEVLLMSGGDDTSAAAAAVRTGCAGFVAKGAPLGDLIEAIRALHSGGIFFAKELLKAVSASPEPEIGLTDREFEILQLLGTGCSAGEISRRLHLSIHTTRTHIRSILHKLDAQSQLDAVVKAVGLGLISIGR